MGLNHYYGNGRIWAHIHATPFATVAQVGTRLFPCPRERLRTLQPELENHPRRISELETHLIELKSESGSLVPLLDRLRPAGCRLTLLN